VKTIALVGACLREDRPGHEVLRFLLGPNYLVIPVNPGLAGKSILGETVRESLAALP
jgi:predicted CoA-binding protein